MTKKNLFFYSFDTYKKNKLCRTKCSALLVTGTFWTRNATLARVSWRGPDENFVKIHRRINKKTTHSLRRRPADSGAQPASASASASPTSTRPKLCSCSTRRCAARSGFDVAALLAMLLSSTSKDDDDDDNDDDDEGDAIEADDDNGNDKLLLLLILFRLRSTRCRSTICRNVSASP